MFQKSLSSKKLLTCRKNRYLLGNEKQPSIIIAHFVYLDQNFNAFMFRLSILTCMFIMLMMYLRI